MILDALKKVGVLTFETIKVIVVSLAIILPIRYFLIQPFYVEGASMEPSFFPHEYLIIDEISYRFNNPARGDVVVFRYPRDPRQYYIKRVIGLPGDRIKIVDGTVYINDSALTESYISELNLSQSSMDEMTVPANSFFVMGDNRGNSLDSRIIGPIDRSYFIGRVWIRGWPMTRVSVFSTPSYP